MFWCEWSIVSIFSCFNVDKITGLTPIPNATRYLQLNQTTPPTGPLSGSASQIIFSEDNNLLIVAVKGTNATNVWDVYQNHTLSCDFERVALPSGGFYPYSATIIPGQNPLLPSDAALGFDIFTNVSGSMNGGGGHAIGSYSQSIPNQIATCRSTYSSKTGNYYLVDLLGSRITEVNVDVNMNSTIVNVGGWYYILLFDLPWWQYYSTGNNTGPLEAGTVSVESKGYVAAFKTCFLDLTNALAFFVSSLRCLRPWMYYQHMPTVLGSRLVSPPRCPPVILNNVSSGRQQLLGRNGDVCQISSFDDVTTSRWKFIDLRDRLRT